MVTLRNLGYETHRCNKEVRQTFTCLVLQYSCIKNIICPLLEVFYWADFLYSFDS